MDVDHRFPQAGVAAERLNGPQIGAGFQQMCNEAVSLRVRMRPGDSWALGGFSAGVADDLVADRTIGGVPATAAEQVCGPGGDNVRAVRRTDGG